GRRLASTWCGDPLGKGKKVAAPGKRSRGNSTTGRRHAGLHQLGFHESTRVHGAPTPRCGRSFRSADEPKSPKGIGVVGVRRQPLRKVTGLSRNRRFAPKTGGDEEMPVFWITEARSRTDGRTTLGSFTLFALDR